MVADIYAQVITLVEQLDETHQAALLRHLQVKIKRESQVTRELILAEQKERLAAGEVDNLPGLVGLFPHPGTDLSFETIEAAIHENSWESELDEFFPDA